MSSVTPQHSTCRDRLASAVSRGDRLRVVLLGAGDRRPHLLEEAARLRPLLEERVEIVLEDFAYQHSLSEIQADMVIVLGGDGSILRAARQMGSHQMPVVGVNLGRLGFLADIQPGALLPMLEAIYQGRFNVVEHLMLCCQIYEDEVLICEDVGLNELAVMGGPPFSMQNLDLYVDEKLATTYSCDGLIVSTPVGSTAHSLSAGGPIVRKNLQAFVISPISPHALTMRPIVDTADRIIDIVVREPNQSTSAVLDGQVISRLSRRHRVRIQRAKSVFQLVEAEGHNYYETLREKLGWGGEFQAKRNAD